MSSINPSTHIIPLANQKLVAGLISYQVQELIQENLKANKKTLLFYNRRAHSHAWICQDCGYFESCPDCDIALAYHKNPKPVLRCHHCSRVSPIPEKCPRCHSLFSIPVGVGIQQIQEGLQSIFETAEIYRIDSDSADRIDPMQEKIHSADIILSTQKWNLIQHDDIASVVFVLFEANFSVPSYDIEEHIYHSIAYFKKQNIAMYIQTFMPNHPILRSVVFENYHDFLTQILVPERKAFSYPPFDDFVIIRVHHLKKEVVQSLITKLTQVIQPQLTDAIFFSAESDVWTRSQGQWNQKIILKWRWILDIIEILTPYIVRNRSVHLEWQ